ncbi:flagellar basal body-associated FliL family protein [Roseococcus sp. YIM B11640]|uniref:flagellar basal body-associated FliL family protein n=1 Tax=Roseococcus sp. YIM B11640 TaxID=3133973 RepID=UPI003C7AE749
MASEASGGAPGGADAKRSKKKRLILLAVPLVLGGAGAGLWFGGILPALLGMQPPPAVQAEVQSAPRQPVFVTIPDITANLNAPGRRSFIRLKSQMEVSAAPDAAALQASMPRLVDLFTTYLREMRPEELRGSAGTHRLREELIARANIVVAPARVTDVLFTEILVQ